MHTGDVVKIKAKQYKSTQ